MKTIKELYEEVIGSEELKQKFAEAARENHVEDFLKEQGCDATLAEVEAFLKEIQEKEGELSDAELDAVSGGCNQIEALCSALSFGIVCAAMATGSAMAGNMTGDKGEMLCNQKYWDRF